MLKRIIEAPGTKALLILPYVALVQEKVAWLRRIVRNVRILESPSAEDESDQPWRQRVDYGTIRVVGFIGGGKIRATWDDFEIGVCTLEKVRRMLYPGSLEASLTSS